MDIRWMARVVSIVMKNEKNKKNAMNLTQCASQTQSHSLSNGDGIRYMKKELETNFTTTFYN